MSPLLLALVAVTMLGVTVNAATTEFVPTTTLVITAANMIEELYVDDNHYDDLPNRGLWQDADMIEIDGHTRLVAIRASNAFSGCSGMMAATFGSPTGIQLVTNSSWRCTVADIPGWQYLGYDDSSWAPAFAIGRNGQLIPGCSVIPIPEFPDTAWWIWTDAFQDGDPRVSCRGYVPVCDTDPCQNGATCLDNAPVLCRCPVRFTGRFCESDINECESNPCLNGGQCDLDESGYSCRCSLGYTGVNCETDVTACASMPCLNGGTCTVDFETEDYVCSCPAGFTGEFCETDIDECESEPCLNQATCIDGPNSVECVCVPGFTGFFCQIDINECASEPCLNLGDCVDLINGYRCNCQTGYTGVNCETPIGDCASMPCMNGGTCTLDGPGDAVLCICPPGWAGQYCHLTTNLCLSTPCLNGGTCLPEEGAYQCWCTDEFYGMHCEAVKPNCGNIMAVSEYQAIRGFWTLCEINVADHAQFVNTRCRDLIQGINYYNNSTQLEQMGGAFGCFVTRFPSDMPDGACVPGYAQDAILANCLSCTHMGVCLREPLGATTTPSPNRALPPAAAEPDKV